MISDHSEGRSREKAASRHSPARGAAKLNRQAILVLGMHRSGTSALARVLSFAGCALPKTTMPGGRGNTAGHWESVRVMEFNDQLLEAVGSRWDDWLPMNVRFAESSEWPDFIKRGAEIVREEFGNAPLFVLKDPRICRVAPLWLDILKQEKIEVRIVMPIRHPLEVAQSLAARDNIDEHFGLLIWLRYVLEAEAASRSMKRVVTNYDDLVEDWQTVVNTISEAVDVVLPRLSVNTARDIDEFISPDERHHKVSPTTSKRNSRVAPWVMEVYRVLDDWRTAGESADGYAKLDEIKAELDAATPMFARPLLTAREDRERCHLLETKMVILEGERGNISNELQVLHERIANDIINLESLQQTIADLKQSQLADMEAVAAAEAEQGRLSVALDAAHQRIATIDEMNIQLGIARAAAEIQAESLLDKVGQQDAALAEFATQNVGLASALKAAQDRSAILDGEVQQVSISSSAKIVDLSQQLAFSQSTLRQREEEVSQLVTETNRLRLAQLDSETELESERSSWQEALSGLERQRDDAAKSADVAQMQMLKAEQICADTRRSLQAMETERNIARRDRDAARDAAAERTQEIARMIGLLRESEYTAQAAQDEIVDLSQQLAFSQSTLRQREEEVSQLVTETNRLRLAQLDSETELESERSSWQEALSGLERQRDDAAKSADVAQMQMLKAEQICADTRRSLQAMETERNIARRDHDAARDAAAERTQEIARMIGLLRESEYIAQAAQDEIDWLRKVNAAAFKVPAWWSLVPRSLRARWKEGLMRSSGVFDADAYRQRYPDVASVNFDPLEHYLLHGITEGRVR